MKIVINKCYGGFGLSLLAKKRYCELVGKKAYFYKTKRGDYNTLIRTDEDPFGGTVYCLLYDFGETVNFREIPEEMLFSSRYIQRNDPILIQVVEELGYEASGSCADLKVVEIPDDVDYTIEEYDGIEWVAEKQRVWN